MRLACGRRARAVRAAGLAGALALLAGCGSTIPVDEEATVLDRDQLNPALVESTTTTTRTGRTVPRRIYFVNAADTSAPEMEACQLEVEDHANRNDAAYATLYRLIQTEPGSEEAGPACSDSLTNFVPTELRVNRVEVEGATITIDITGLSAVEAGPQRQAVSQIVYTLTDLGGIGRVLFTNEDRPIAVSVGPGRTVEGGTPVTRADFPDQANPAPPATGVPVPPAPEGEPTADVPAPAGAD